MGEGAKFASGVEAKVFMLAGRSTLTLVSMATGARFTYSVRQVGESKVHFVSVLSGPNNGSDYEFVGTIFDGARFAHGSRSRISRDAPSARAFAWAFQHLVRASLPPLCEVWHEGRCGRCGRALTVPESIASGIGPVCEGLSLAS
jgi:hypothetical protein